MKKTSLILGLTALLAVSLTFMGCPKTSDPTPTPSTSDPSSTTEEDKKNDDSGKEENKGTECNFTCTVQSWGANGSYQMELPSTLTVAEGDVVVINGTFDFGTPSSGKILQFYPQECVGWEAPDYNWISDYSNGLAGQSITMTDYEWTIVAKSAGEWSKIQWMLGWENNDDAKDATCVVTIKDFTITKK